MGEDSDSSAATHPHRNVDIEDVDDVRSRATDGSRSVDTEGQRYGVFDELEPVDIGAETNVAVDHDLIHGTGSDS